jgi:N-methylhydantoinase B
MAPYYVISDIIGGGMGGSAKSDGLDAIDTHGGNCAILSAEITETLSPLRILETALVAGSGGAGRHRGGLGIRRDYQFLSDRTIMGAYVQQTREETRPWGLDGGGPGAAAGITLNPGTPDERQLKSKIYGLKLKKGDVMRFQGAGGGGWGDPAKRDEAAKARDEAEGFA